MKSEKKRKDMVKHHKKSAGNNRIEDASEGSDIYIGIDLGTTYTEFVITTIKIRSLCVKTMVRISFHP